MTAIVVIEGREFAVGDVVLVDVVSHGGRKRWVAGTIVAVLPGPFPIRVSPCKGSAVPGVMYCDPREVHSIRENFA